MRPYAVDRLQRDIERFYRLNDSKNALDAAKKMLKNGLLGLFSIIHHRSTPSTISRFRLSQTCGTHRRYSEDVCSMLFESK